MLERIVRVQVPAKVNLVLCVGPRREDGYHEVASVMQAVSLFDEVSLSEEAPSQPSWTDPASGSTLTLRAVAGAPDAVVDAVLAGPRNLVWRAALTLAERTGRWRGGKLARPLHMEVAKAIPVGSGLGGGSADAAATLVALNALWGLGLPAEALLDMGAVLGSDVPFFIYGGTALAAGRGERILPLPPATGWLVLANPGTPVPTPSVYHALDEDRATEVTDHPGSWSLAARDATEWLTLRALDPQRPVGELPFVGRNDLEAPARRLHSFLEDTAAAMRGIGLSPHLSGSGGTFWAAAVSEAEARAAAASLSGRGWWSVAAAAVPFGARPAGPDRGVKDSRTAGRSN